MEDNSPILSVATYGLVVRRVDELRHASKAGYHHKQGLLEDGTFVDPHAPVYLVSENGQRCC